MKPNIFIKHISLILVFIFLLTQLCIPRHSLAKNIDHKNTSTISPKSLFQAHTLENILSKAIPDMVSDISQHKRSGNDIWNRYVFWSSKMLNNFQASLKEFFHIISFILAEIKISLISPLQKFFKNIFLKPLLIARLLFLTAMILILPKLLCSSPKMVVINVPPAYNDLNVVFIVLDGVRPYEFFKGTQKYQFRRYRKSKSKTKAKTNKQIFPFLWKESRKFGQVSYDGNRFKGKACVVSNPYRISLPGYADLLSGYRQSNVTSNYFKKTVEYPTILDQLH
ncbi:hypothetical protein ACFLQ1_02365, partial [Candidatus Auribacterota bacterium]